MRLAGDNPATNATRSIHNFLNRRVRKCRNLRQCTTTVMSYRCGRSDVAALPRYETACEPSSSTSTCRPSASRCGRCVPRDAARMLVVRPGTASELEDRVVRDLPRLLRPGDALVVNDTKVIPARLQGRRIGRGAEPKIEATLHRAARRLALARLREAGEAARGRRRHPLRRRGPGLLPRPTRRHGRSQGRGRRSDAALRVSRPGARPGDRRTGRHAAAALHRRASRAPDERDRADYQTLFAADGGLGRGADRGPAFHRRSAGAGSRARHRACTRSRCMSAPARSCRSRPRTPPTTSMHAEWGSLTAATADALNAVHAPRRAHRRGRHRRRCACSKARPARMAASGRFAGDTAIFITPGYRFRAVDVLMTNFHLPRSTLFMLVSALLRPRRDAARLCARDRRRLPLLFLWRRLPAVSRQPDTSTMTDAFSFRLIGHRRRRAPRRVATPRGAVPTPAFMPVGTAGDGQGLYARSGARRRRRHPARQHLSPDAAAGRRARRGARRPAPLHELAARRSSPIPAASR